MKRAVPLIIALALVFLAGNALASIPAKPSGFQFAYDYTNTLSAADKDEIAAYGQALLDATGGKNSGDQAVALVVDFLDGMEPADYATDVINSWGLGDNSLLILLATGDRAIEIAAGRGLDRLFSAASRGEVIDANIDYLANNQFADGLVAIYEAAVTRTATLRGKTLSLPGTQSGTQTGIANTGTTGTNRSSGGGMGILGIILIVIVAFIVIRMLGNRRRRRVGRRGPAAPIQPARPMRPAAPPRPAGPRARAGGVFDAPPPPQGRMDTPPSPQRQPRMSTPPAPGRRTGDAGRVAGSVLGGLFSGSSISYGGSSSSSSRSSGSSSRSSSSSSGGSLGRSGGSRGSSAGRKF